METDKDVEIGKIRELIDGIRGEQGKDYNLTDLAADVELIKKILKRIVNVV